MDPENSVVKLCVAGMKAEETQEFEHAHQLFEKAWIIASDDFERCIASHYLARHQPTSEETLRWNQESLQWAERVNDDRVAAFFPSLFLNLGQSYEALGQVSEARGYYERASVAAQKLPDDRYGNLVRTGATAGRERNGRQGE